MATVFKPRSTSPLGTDLFFDFSSFLNDLSEHDESVIAGGSRSRSRSNSGRRRRRRRRMHYIKFKQVSISA
ncbi:conserved hypothetical protein [Hyella patelloides LEGE 07179]|uniref:Uncharacterized protein n=1 Tax=Hyella patelloides LEGE 07179 TaxID=945734 RepID=A0A563VR65_9CYAN|nr:hypothetical protein [Hyella patelloides]VEP13757.1 conserved hypothetical protein [Hyella patelloides LEGE 07179]